MDNQIEKWRTEVLESMGGMERAQPNPFLFAKIKERIQTATGITVKPAYLRLAFASLALLFVLNVSAIVKTSLGSNKAIVEDYTAQAFSQSYNLYD